MSSSDEIRKLKQENARLQSLVERDSLTGLYNRSASERRINEALKQFGTGMMYVIDMDAFKQINDQYGHFNGDIVLKELAQVLRQVFFPRDIIGRIGGDEFIVFAAPCQTAQFLLDKGKRVIAQMRQYGKKMKFNLDVSVTMGVATSMSGDTYATMFERADFALLSGKQQGGAMICLEPLSGTTVQTIVESNASESNAIDRDVELIWADLREKGYPEGAFCQGYNNFLCIYRFVERGLVRSPSSAYVILLTLTDEKGELIEIEWREKLMLLLSKTVCASLRLGDVYTQYSSFQFLLMVLDTTYANAMMIVARIRKNLRDTVPANIGIGIDCVAHPLRPRCKEPADAESETVEADAAEDDALHAMVEHLQIRCNDL